MKGSFFRRMFLIAVLIAGGIVTVMSFYSMYAHALPWIVDKWGYEKGGPWLFGIIGLAMMVWAGGELVLERRE